MHGTDDVHHHPGGLILSRAMAGPVQAARAAASSRRASANIALRGQWRRYYCRGVNAAPAPNDRLDPVTIVPDRYSGTYSGAPWLAFPLNPSDVPDEPSGGDIIAATWWAQAGDVPVGRGDTPDHAHADLLRRLEAIEPAHKHPPASKLSNETWTWELRWPSGKKTTAFRSWRGENSGPRR
jgi:hypothetical protein